jgi:signal transduction histidine kinase
MLSDSPQDEGVIQSILQRQQYSVHLAHSDEFIIDRIATLQPDLVLLNTNVLPEPVIALCRQIKQRVSGRYLPLLLLVMSNSRVKTRQLQLFGEITAQTGADDVLFKPVHRAELIQRMLVLMRLSDRVESLRVQNHALTRQLEERDRELNRALSGSREISVLKDSIVNNVSHELRTPMLQVKSAVAMLEAEARSTPSLGGMARLLEYATKSTSRLENVIQNITQLITSTSLKSEAFRVVDAAHIALRQLGRSWSSAGSVSRVELQIDEMPLVLGDKNGVAQVLQQLIDNGLKFSPNGETVIVSASHLENGVQIAVADNGIGVDEDQIERIFQEFYQVEQGTTRRFGGAGTGLAIVKLILDRLGVNIEVKSRPGEGSVFSFVLPFAPQD